MKKIYPTFQNLQVRFFTFKRPRHLSLIIILISMTLISFACSFPSTSTAVPPATTAPEVTKGIPSDTPEPTEITETATETPTNTPQTAEPESLLPIFLPAGFVADSGNTERPLLSTYNLKGELITEVPALGMAKAGSPTSVHVAGRFADEETLPIVYISTENDGSLQYFDDGEIITVAITPNISYLIGTLGQSSMVYTTAVFKENALVSELFIGDLETLYEAEPVMVRTDSAGWTFRPMAITMVGEQPIGIWYSLTPWGIGGDIVFEPRQGLFYLDLTSNRVAEHVDPSINPSSFSPDLTWLAYTMDDMEQPLIIMPDLDTERAITFPLAAESNRGAGNAVFSPDNQFVAWMEGSGMRLAAVPDFNILIRIASTEGEIITEFPANAVAEAVGTQDIQWIEPVGWLDEETLLLQVHFDTWAQTDIVRVKYDGSDISSLASGSFAAFIYPQQ
jgi:hypothetical protein